MYTGDVKMVEQKTGLRVGRIGKVIQPEPSVSAWRNFSLVNAGGQRVGSGTYEFDTQVSKGSYQHDGETVRFSLRSHS